MDPSTHAHTPAPRDAAMIAPEEHGAPQDPLDAILRQIVDGYFVLTDGQGAVSKWSEPAELLFGREAGEVLGQSFFSTLVGDPVPATADAWRRFLEAGDAPSVPGRTDVSGVHADGTTFPMEAVFVPVKLDEGFDFSLFLEDLGFELPMNLMLLRMRQQHPVVVRALRQALEPEPQPWEGWRTAGTLVIFRPLAPTPWVEFELAAREAARAEADAATEERLTNIDPGIQGDVNDLDDAAAVVARLLSAMERIDELERVARGLPGQLEEARQSAERRAEAAEREARALRDEMQRALSADDQRDLLARLERLERARLDAEQATADRSRALAAAEAARAELKARLDRLDELGGDVDHRVTALAGEQAEIRARADEAAGAAGQLAERLDEVDRGAGGVLEDVRAVRERADEVAGLAAAARAAGERAEDRLESLDSRVDGLRTEMATGHERLDALGSRVERFGEEIGETGRAARAALEAQGAELRQELAAVRRVAEDARTGLDAFREELRGVSDTATRRVDAMQAELTSALGSLEEVKAGLTSAGQAAVMARREAEQAKKAVGEGHSGINEVFQQLLAAARSGGQGAATSAQAPRRALATAKPEGVNREPRDGFDDLSQPCALLGLDGIFRELNPSFARLVGYQEHEFAKAAWPSPHDRASYQQQQEQLRQLVSGEIESVSVQSTYMHGQGLMVPVVGTIRAVLGEDGRPLHLLLEAEERTHG